MDFSDGGSGQKSLKGLKIAEHRHDARSQLQVEFGVHFTGRWGSPSQMALPESRVMLLCLSLGWTVSP